MKTFTIENSFHGTTTTIDLPENGRRLTKEERLQIEEKLCGMSDCCCEKVIPGDHQDCVWDLTPAGNVFVRPLPGAAR